MTSPDSLAVTPGGLPRCAVVIPVLDEEPYIAGCLESLIPQLDQTRAEILVMDGGSTDRTREIVDRYARRFPFLSLHENPKRRQSTAVNLAARIASPGCTVILRADAHAKYPENYVREVVTALVETGANSVVVPVLAVGRHGFQKAVAAAHNSRLGNGGARHRLLPARPGPVDHGYHAAFNRELFLANGGYDEAFTHNEDAELDLRTRRAGGMVWLCATTHLVYFPRSSVGALARQYFNYGRGRSKTVHAHRAIKPRHLAPVTVFVTVAASLALAPLTPWALSPTAAYFGFCNLYAVAVALKARDRAVAGMGAAAIVMHMSWSAGFLTGCIKGLAGSSGGGDGTAAPGHAELGRRKAEAIGGTGSPGAIRP